MEVPEKTYSNSTWQNQTFDAATAVATQMSERLTDLGHRLGLAGLPSEVEVNGDRIKKSALQYIENHDHFRFVCNFGTISRDNNDLLKEGDRSRWYKVQPYLIAMMMARGIPMLWQGQEFCENFYVPEGGLGRVVMLRPMRWDYFYDFYGKKMIWLVRRLMKLRRNHQFQYGDHWFYDDPQRYPSKGVLLFSRRLEDTFSLIALNFGDGDQIVPFRFPVTGIYYEELHEQEQDSFQVSAGEEREITVPSNYGRIWSVKG